MFVIFSEHFKTCTIKLTRQKLSFQVPQHRKSDPRVKAHTPTRKSTTKRPLPIRSRRSLLHLHIFQGQPDFWTTFISYQVIPNTVSRGQREVLELEHCNKNEEVRHEPGAAPTKVETDKRQASTRLFNFRFF